MEKCLHCGENALIWDNDESFEDCGYIGEGLIHFYHCDKCGAVIKCFVSEQEDDDETENRVRADRCVGDV